MIISPAKFIKGSISLPGDKSISHRTALIASLANGTSEIEGFATSLDCHSTLNCLRNLGVSIQETKNKLIIEGINKTGFYTPKITLDAGNSGSTIRMLSGILAGQSFTTTITGDESLLRRPMKRIVTPLRQMGANIQATNSDFAPLTISGGNLQAIKYDMPIASAQVKSSILFAGLFAEGNTIISEPTATRNHSELMLKEFGANITSKANIITISGESKLTACHYNVPGDISSAAFLIAATILLPNSELFLQSVGINPTRRAILDVLLQLGANIEFINTHIQHGEPVSDLLIKSSNLASNDNTRILKGNIIANLIDEVPILSILATQIKGGLVIRDAGELRVKESDRIRSIVDNLRSMKVEVEEYSDGLAINGEQNLIGTEINSMNDHRIAMAFTVAGLIAKNNTKIINSECVDISFPNFFSKLASVTTYL
ncbi:MAG: 3-phosphoshikimate 1-carboxyvinyltransferase [Acidobacteria bacterium]|nr:3-phosphoshikimate 1-carboxyvinyltransferase [Acidobacteriota bacterium]